MPQNKEKFAALFATIISSFMASFMFSALNVAYPVIQKEFSVNSILLTWIVTAYILSTAVLLVPIGKIADIYGRKKIFILGIIIFSIAAFLCVFANSIEHLLVLRVFQGIGASMFITTGLAIITSVFPLQERGKAIGFVVASIYIGLSIGPFTGGILTHYLGWRSIFLLTGPIGAATFFLSLVYLKGEWADAAEEKFDLIGSVVYSVSLVLLIYGLSELPGRRALLAVPGIILMIVFVRHELRIKYPIFEISLFKINRIFRYSSLAALISYAATFGVTFLLSLYLQYIFKLLPQTTGLILAVVPITQAVFSPFAGKLSDRIEPAVIASIGMGLDAVGLFLLIFLSPETSLIYIICILFLLGLGFAFFSSPNTNAILSSVEKKYYGIASGIVATMRTIGMTLCMAMTSVVFALIIGKVEIVPANYIQFEKSVKILFSIFTVLCIAAVYFSAVRGQLKRS